jgi:hypothetical protein
MSGPQPNRKRFTVDLPVDLHLELKLECVRRGVNMVAVIQDLIEREFLKTKARKPRTASNEHAEYK